MVIRNKYHILLGITMLFFYSCQSKNSEKNNRNADCDQGLFTGYEVNHIPLLSFEGKNDLENKVIAKVKKHLVSKKISIDSLLVSHVSYPDTTLECNLAYDGKFFMTIDLTHQMTVDYQSKIKEENTRLAKEHEGEESVPVLPPPTGNISGKDRIISYYFEGDSIVDVLSQ